MDSKTIVLNAMRSQGATDAAALAAKSVDGDADGTTLIAAEPVQRSGIQVMAGT